MPTPVTESSCRLLLVVDCGRDREIEPGDWVYQGSRNQQIIQGGLRRLVEELPGEVVEVWGWDHRVEEEWDLFVRYGVSVELQMATKDLPQLWEAWDSWRDQYGEWISDSGVRGAGRDPLMQPLISREQALQQVAGLADRLGEGLDAGMINTVAACRRWGIETTASCQGHHDHGLAFPWLDCSQEAWPWLQALLGPLRDWQALFSPPLDQVDFARETAGRLRFQPPEDLEPEVALAQLQSWAEQLLQARDFEDLLQQGYC